MAGCCDDACQAFSDFLLLEYWGFDLFQEVELRLLQPQIALDMELQREMIGNDELKYLAREAQIRLAAVKLP